MYTYKKAKSGILPEEYEEIYLFGKKYEISGSNKQYFLGNCSDGGNDWIFKNVINEDKNKFFEKVLGSDNYMPVCSTAPSSPYAKSLEGMRKILLAIWEYEFFKPGDKVVIVMDKLEDKGGLSYADSTHVTDAMKRMVNKQFTIKSANVCSNGDDTESYHIIYKLKEDKDNWWWPYHTLKKVTQSQEYCIENTEGVNNKPNNRIGTVKLPIIKKLKIVL